MFVWWEKVAVRTWVRALGKKGRRRPWTIAINISACKRNNAAKHRSTKYRGVKHFYPIKYNPGPYYNGSNTRFSSNGECILAEGISIPYAAL